MVPRAKHILAVAERTPSLAHTHTQNDIEIYILPACALAAELKQGTQMFSKICMFATRMRNEGTNEWMPAGEGDHSLCVCVRVWICAIYVRKLFNFRFRWKFWLVDGASLEHSTLEQ